MPTWKKPDPGLAGLLDYLRKMQDQKELALFVTEEDQDRADGPPSRKSSYHRGRIKSMRSEAEKFRGWADRVEAVIEVGFARSGEEFMGEIRIKLLCVGTEITGGKPVAVFRPLDMGGQFDGPPAGKLVLGNLTQQPFKEGCVYTFKVESVEEKMTEGEALAS